MSKSVSVNPIRVIVAATREGGIGTGGRLPWRLRADTDFFRDTTTRAEPGKRNVVIMGRKTWESLPLRCRPLPRRLNVVVTGTKIEKDGHSTDFVRCVPTFAEAMGIERERDDVDQVFVIGGAMLYATALRWMEEHGRDHEILLTEIHHPFSCDTFFAYDADKYSTLSRSELQCEAGIQFRYVQLKWNGDKKQPTPHDEYQYLRLVRKVLAEGHEKSDRTGTGTLSLFGERMRFCLRDSTIPLLTTKRVFWRGVVEELLWFIRGSTDAGELAAKGVHIWDGNGSREFLDEMGFTDREVGDLGPVYGFQWRHFGGVYLAPALNHKSGGIDQLAEVVRKLRTCPDDRRILMCAWSPDIDEMVLPPCHVLTQFYVANGELSCQMYQRSADIGLGVPFNIASYALLTHMLAHVCGLRAGEFIHIVGDAHIYKNHVAALNEQLEREPLPFPRLRFRRQVAEIDDFQSDDFELVGYKCHGPIRMEMAV